MKKNKGFTLVELLVVIVILALIMIIVIPNIINIMNNAQKSSFYLFGESVYDKALTKYTSDDSNNKSDLDCAVYDIKNDLDISNTGNYVGWVRVTRTPSDTGNYSYRVTLSSDKEFYNVAYCIQGNGATSCTPNSTSTQDSTYKTSYWEPGVKHDSTSNTYTSTVTQTLSDTNYVLCANYQYAGSDNTVKTSTPVCAKVSNASSISNCNTLSDTSGTTVCKQTNGTYDYNVYLSLSDGT